MVCTQGRAITLARLATRRFTEELLFSSNRYRTQICNDGAQCNRSVCFFAHSLEELRVPPHKPGFPPEWRNRRHSRSNSTGNSNSPPSTKCSTQHHTSTGLARALSVPVPVSCDKEGGYKMQMSDGTWGSPGRRVSRVSFGWHRPVFS